MSDIMKCMSFEQLLYWVTSEHDTKGSVFGVRRPYTADPADAQEIFGRPLETVIGPAAGPHSQLSQNIIASYYAGARFFELKTVQKMDGRELAACVNKPCIKADDEGYNCEWSTELTVPEAQHEYINAWVMLNFIAKEYGLGSQDGFQFNISVGYDLAGIKTPKIDTFINNMMEAKDTEEFKHAIAVLRDNLSSFKNFTEADIDAIRSDIVNDATISTLHGCPPHEIEAIATYLINEKGLNTFIKCNPTLLGYEFARSTMDAMGYDYLVFGRFHFDDDLQYVDAIPMLKRLMALCDEKGLAFGVKITNTFPVDVTRGELPSNEMYMSGRALYVLSISLAAKLSRDLEGRLRISYSGGADYFNIDKIVDAGIWPVTVATTLLKTGGYQRFSQMAEKLRGVAKPFAGIDVEKLNALAESAVTDVHHVKAAKPLPNRKTDEKVPLLNCFFAPCTAHCPIHQDVSSYMAYAEKGDFDAAMKVVLDTNALPFMTGSLCAHPCQNACTRNFYESQVNIRNTKLTIARAGIDNALGQLMAKEPCGLKVGVIGGGPAGMAAAYFLARESADVTIFEKNEKLGGVPRYVIPKFRIEEAEIEKDIDLLRALGVKFETGRAVTVQEVKDLGFETIIAAIGAPGEGRMKIDGITPMNALAFLAEFNKTDGNVDLGKNVVVVGGGNTAMDTARAALKNSGVEKVSLVYRRTKRYMPADEEELYEAIEDGVEFRELTNPVSYKDGILTCAVMQLGAMDESGRASVTETEERVEIPVDTVIIAVGEKCDKNWYDANGINTDAKGRPLVDGDLQSSVPGVYIIGDGLYGPSIIVKAEANAHKACDAILRKNEGERIEAEAEIDADDLYAKKGILAEACDKMNDNARCLHCNVICENCVDVCPNRANIEVKVPGIDMPQIVHVDYMCNECGNCATFCPYASKPYKEKFTLFANEADMADSTNDGFVVLDITKKSYKVRFLGKESVITADNPGSVPGGIVDLMNEVLYGHWYMLLRK